jgi:hypothetical protein
VYTLIETPTFAADADKLWSEEERLEFFEWLANNPDSGDVIPGSGGCRKVRWVARRLGQARRGTGHLLHPVVGGRNLAPADAKAARDNIPGHLLKAVREEIENG